MRRSIELPGITHKAPIPAGALVGNLLVSSGIGGRDPATGEYPDDVASQVRFAFGNVRALVEAAGGDVEDIAKVTVFLRDRDDRRHVDEEWLTMFPDEASRPARHALPLGREGKALIQLEVIAVIGGDGGPA
jgi:2-iminobutanoate/2-iminopropanoate deaminase